MKRILFVDDEKLVLDGLRMLLRKDRHRWELVFAIGAEAALAEIARARFDVVVCDMRMPAMDGAALLERVKDLNPTATRIILSGQADRAAVLRAMPVAHQFVAKPCEADALRATLERACAMKDLLADDRLRALVGALDRLPSPPDVYWELTRAVEDASTTNADLARVIEKDPATAIKLLQLVNSPFFVLSRPVTSIQEAIAHSGVDMLRSLVLSAHVFAVLDAQNDDGISTTRLCDHAVKVACAARDLARSGRIAEEAFATGLVHDAGELVLAAVAPERFAETIRDAEERGVPRHVVERERFGATHAEIGAYLLGMWGLPLAMVDVVAHHHDESAASANGEVAALVRAADVAARSTERRALTPSGSE